MGSHDKQNIYFNIFSLPDWYGSGAVQTQSGKTKFAVDGQTQFSSTVTINGRTFSNLAAINIPNNSGQREIKKICITKSMGIVAFTTNAGNSFSIR